MIDKRKGLFSPSLLQIPANQFFDLFSTSDKVVVVVFIVIIDEVVFPVVAILTDIDATTFQSKEVVIAADGRSGEANGEKEVSHGHVPHFICRSLDYVYYYNA